MSFDKLIYVLLLTWAISCVYYAWRIRRISHATGASFFSSIGKSSRSSHNKIRKLFIQVIVTSIFFLIVIILAYFVSQSTKD